MLTAAAVGGYLLRANSTSPIAAPGQTTAPPPTGSSQDLAQLLAVTVPSQAKDGQDRAGNPVSYPAGNMTDGDPTTCWRMNGDAAGQQLTISVPGSHRITSVGLVNGYAKVDPSSGEDRYRQERRITRVTWQFPGMSVEQTLDPSDRSVQSVRVPGAPQASQVVLRIDATSPGDVAGFDYTAISTLEIQGQ